MVQNILMSYYNIPLNDQSFFHYQGKDYYLSSNTTNYLQYILLTSLKPYILILNNKNKPHSKNYTLYTYQNTPVSLYHVLSINMYIVDTISIQEFKNKCIYYSDVKISKFKDYMYITYSTLAIQLINEYLLNIDIPLSYNHNICKLETKYIMNPDNIIIDYYLGDLCKLYLDSSIDIKMIIDLFDYYKIKNEHYLMMFVYMLIYDDIDIQKLLEFYHLLIDKDIIQSIDWIDSYK